MDYIESAANGKIRSTAALHLRKERERRGEFVAEGIRLVETAVASDWPILFCLVTKEALSDIRVKKIIYILEQRNHPVYVTNPAVYKKAASTDTPQGIMVVMKKKTTSLSSLNINGIPLWVVADRIQDPGNAGTILRTADAAGCSAFITINGTVDIFSDKTVRASMGSLFHLPIVTQVPPSELISFINDCNISCFASALDKSAIPHFAAALNKPAAVIFGNEGNGISKELLDAVTRIYIPMAGQAESLNVASAAAIILYEAFRQRNFQGAIQQR